MRIGFLGKGGSGKTTISAAFAYYLSQQGNSTRFIDADVNMHSNLLFNIPKSDLKPLAQRKEELIDYCFGQRKDVKNVPIFAQIPPNKDSRMLYLSSQDPLLSHFFCHLNDNLHFMALGSYEEADTGFECYHSKCDNLEILLNHLLDRKDQYLIVDSVTGIDNVGTGLIYSYDLNILVVEPTKKSIQVYLDFVQAISKLDFQVNYMVVVNKILDEDDKIFVLEYIPQDKIITFLPDLNDLVQVDYGNHDSFPVTIKAFDSCFEHIVTVLSRFSLDRQLYLENIKKSFSFYAKTYYNDYYSLDYLSRIKLPLSYFEFTCDAET